MRSTRASPTWKSRAGSRPSPCLSPTGPHIDTVRLMPSGPETTRVAVEASRIRTIALSSRDPAAGKSWESWVRRYAEKKLKGERAEIQSEPLDEPPAGTVRG